jgi:hypothetical protein
VGTNGKPATLAMRTAVFDACTRDFRRRHFLAKHGHAALRRTSVVIREYQSDSSSKRPISSLAFGARAGPCPSPRNNEVDRGSFHIS